MSRYFKRILESDLEQHIREGWSHCAEVPCESPSLAAQGMRGCLVERSEDEPSEDKE